MSRRSYNKGLTDMRLPNAVQDYDGNWYDAVLLCEQVWLGSNLRTTHYADGTAIADGGTTLSEVDKYYYNNTASSFDLKTRGLYYNPAAIMNDAATSTSNPSSVQGVAMTGWHIPSEAEYSQLFDYLVSKPKYWYGHVQNISYTAKAVASNNGWNELDSSYAYTVGYNQIINGRAYLDMFPVGVLSRSSFQREGDFTYLAISIRSSNGGSFRTLNLSKSSNTLYIGAYGYGESYGLSVRCVCNMNAKQFLKWYLQQYGSLNHQVN